MYGCETWKLTKTEENIDRSFQTKSLGRIHKVRWQQHVQNKTGLEMTETENINGKEVELD